MALIEIDGLPINSWVDLSMANCECHNQMVVVSVITCRSFIADWEVEPS